MNILYVANEWDYGDPTAGRSFEHYNFYDSLRQMGHRIIYFDYFQNSRRQGNEAMNRDLEQLVKDERPDLLFACFMYDEVSRETMRRITASDAPAKYEAMGYKNAIKTQWGANPHAYPIAKEPNPTVTFVGRPHGDRHLYLEPLRRAGIDVWVFGPGQVLGRMTQERMIATFMHSG